MTLRSLAPVPALVLALLAVGVDARAESTSLFSVGVGTGVGVSRHTPFKAASTSSFSSELSLKVKMLHFLGLELAYSPTDGLATAGQSDALVFDSKFRLSGLLYVVPTYPVGLYLKGGLGGGRVGDLFDVASNTSSYHAGGGLDVHIGSHVVLAAEFLLLIPGVESIKQTLTTVTNQEIARFQAAGKPGTPETPELGVSDFISGNNFRVGLNARWFF